MKDIIGVISGIIALCVFITCIINGVAIESALLRSLISLIAANLIGLALLGVTVVTMYKKHTNTTEENLSDKDNTNQAPLKA